MKLYIDDIRFAPDNSWTVARTVTSAVAFIAQFGSQLTEISLDHDISHQVTVGDLSRPYPCVETFQPVAWFIAFYYSSLPKGPKITIHTSNPDGAEKMKSIILSQVKDVSIVVKPMGAANRLELEV